MRRGDTEIQEDAIDPAEEAAFRALGNLHDETGVGGPVQWHKMGEGWSWIRKHGGRPLLWKTGHSLIKSKLRETGAPLAGEMSGHIFFKHRWYGFDDALYASVRLIEAVASSGRSLTELMDAMPQSSATPEMRFQVQESRKFAVVDEVLDRLRSEGAEVDPTDGARVKTADGWWLLRASNTQDVLVARAEPGGEPAHPVHVVAGVVGAQPLERADDLRRAVERRVDERRPHESVRGERDRRGRERGDEETPPKRHVRSLALDKFVAELLDGFDRVVEFFRIAQNFGVIGRRLRLSFGFRVVS